jgi:hypothetical protein
MGECLVSKRGIISLALNDTHLVRDTVTFRASNETLVRQHEGRRIERYFRTGRSHADRRRSPGRSQRCIRGHARLSNLPEWSDAVDHSFNDFGDTSAVYTERCTAVCELSDMLWNVGDVSRVDGVRCAQLLRHLQSAVSQINRNDLFHFQILCTHEGSQTDTSHPEDDNTFVGFRFEDVEYCPCSSLEPTATGSKDPHFLGLSGKLHHARFTYDA